MAASQSFKIVVNGKETHGSQPWVGIDPIMISAKVIGDLQTIISREVNLSCYYYWYNRIWCTE